MEKQKLPGRSNFRELEESNQPGSLYGKGTAAAAGALDVRVIELEARAFERLDVVDRNAFQIHLAHLVDKNLETLELVYVVAILIDLVFEGHVIAETRATTAHNGNAQAGGFRSLLQQNLFYLHYCGRRKLNHRHPPADRARKPTRAMNPRTL